MVSRKVDEGPLLNIEPSRSVQEGRACDGREGWGEASKKRSKEEEQRDVRETWEGPQSGAV